MITDLIRPRVLCANSFLHSDHYDPHRLDTQYFCTVLQETAITVRMAPVAIRKLLSALPFRQKSE